MRRYVLTHPRRQRESQARSSFLRTTPIQGLAGPCSAAKCPDLECIVLRILIQSNDFAQVPAHRHIIMGSAMDPRMRYFADIDINEYVILTAEDKDSEHAAHALCSDIRSVFIELTVGVNEGYELACETIDRMS